MLDAPPSNTGGKRPSYRTVRGTSKIGARMTHLIAGSVRSLRPHAPPTWSAAWVRSRLVEAFEVEARLPTGNGNGATAWPFPVMHDFAEMVGWPDARQRVWDDWRRARGAYPFEVTRMEESLAWLRLLRNHTGERRCLSAWAHAVSRGRSVRPLVRRKGWSPATFYRKVSSGSERIARVLNARGVLVR